MVAVKSGYPVQAPKKIRGFVFKSFVYLHWQIVIISF